MIPQYDSASYLIGRNPLVSGADYDDLDKEIAEEDHEEDEEDYDNDEEGYVNSVGERSFGINAQKSELFNEVSDMNNVRNCLDRFLVKCSKY